MKEPAQAGATKKGRKAKNTAETDESKEAAAGPADPLYQLSCCSSAAEPQLLSLRS